MADRNNYRTVVTQVLDRDCLPLNLNLNRICRICLVESENNRAMSEMSLSECPSIPKTYLEMFSEVSLKIVDDNNLPKLICQECIDLLIKAYKFKIKYTASHKIIENYLNYTNKAENTSLEENSEATRLEPILPLSPSLDDTVVSESFSDDDQKPETDFNEDVNCNNRNGDQVKHTCPICFKEFTSEELRGHVQSHKDLQKYLNIPDRYKIRPGTKFIANKRTIASIFTKSGNKHKCPFCSEYFSTDVFKFHIRNHQNQNFKCDKCDRVFKKLNHLNNHRRMHLKEYPYKCETCGKQFIIEKNYDCHKLTHADAELPHECPHCYQKFTNPNHLLRHVIIHTENISYAEKYKKMKCRQCSKEYFGANSYYNHKCIPDPRDRGKTTETETSGTSNKKSFPCKSCNETFRSSTSCYNHFQTVHRKRKPVLKVLCPVCGRYVSNMSIHMPVHTKDKPFQCNLCDRKFVMKQHLKQHLFLHTGAKPFICTYCARAFNNVYNLQAHERIHKGDKSYVCPVCSKAFLEKSYLKKHKCKILE